VPLYDTPPTAAFEGEILDRLFALNAERAREEREKQDKRPPRLRVVKK